MIGVLDHAFVECHCEDCFGSQAALCADCHQCKGIHFWPEDQMTASDHLKQRTGSLGGDQDRIDISNLRFYAQMAREFQWQTDVIHWSVIEQTLSEVAQRTEAALAQKTREVEEDMQLLSHEIERRLKLEAQVEQLGRQVVDMSKPVTDEEWVRFWDGVRLKLSYREAVDVLIASRARTK